MRKDKYVSKGNSKMTNIGLEKVLCDITINKNNTTKCIPSIGMKLDSEGHCIFKGEYLYADKTGKGKKRQIK